MGGQGEGRRADRGKIKAVITLQLGGEGEGRNAAQQGNNPRFYGVFCPIHALMLPLLRPHLNDTLSLRSLAQPPFSHTDDRTLPHTASPLLCRPISALRLLPTSMSISLGRQRWQP